LNGIHPTAVVHARARLGSDCVVGPYCVIGENVVLGDRCLLHSHVVIEGHTTLGRDNEIFPFACLGKRAQVLKVKDSRTHTEIGDENIFREQVTVHSATAEGGVTRIGSRNLLMAGAHVAHDCKVGSHTVLCNLVLLAGHVTLEDHVILSGMAGVQQFCRVGRNAMVGGITKIVQDVPPFMIADGNPARVRAINQIGLERQGFSTEAQVALKQAFKLLFRQGLTTAKAIAQIETTLPNLPEVRQLLEFLRASVRGVTR